ncbi:MAG: cation transporting ATPase C-terminal domain-containing protein [Deltaproteobacteria bacterium]|nr:cation transporting ATPase C-terminal domain-containing protein [Deltaproteobacteria bacterium]
MQESMNTWINWKSRKSKRNRISRQSHWLSVPLLLVALYLPGVSTALHTVSIGANGWGLLFGISLVTLLIGQGIKQFMPGASIKNP